MDSHNEVKLIDHLRFLCLKRINYGLTMGEIAMSMERRKLMSSALDHYKKSVDILRSETKSLRSIGNLIMNPGLVEPIKRIEQSVELYEYRISILSIAYETYLSNKIVEQDEATTRNRRSTRNRSFRLNTLDGSSGIDVRIRKASLSTVPFIEKPPPSITADRATTNNNNTTSAISESISLNNSHNRSHISSSSSSSSSSNGTINNISSDTSSDMNKPPSDPFRLTYWKMKLIYDILNNDGGYLTPRVYIPAELWVQDLAKVLYLKEKLIAFEGINIKILQIKKLGLPKDMSSDSLLIELCTSLYTSIPETQNSLRRYFSFIPISKNTIATTTASPSSFKRFTAGVVKITTSVVKTVGDSVTTTQRITSAELKRYSKIVASLFEAAQHLLQLKTELEREVDGGITSSNRSRRKRNSEKSVFLKNSTSVQEIIHMLNEITSFFEIVAVPLVVQDFSYLLQRYLRKTKKSLVNPMVSHNRG